MGSSGQATKECRCDASLCEYKMPRSGQPPQISEDEEIGIKMALCGSVLIRCETGIDDGEVRTGGDLEPIEGTDERLVTFLEEFEKDVVSRDGIYRMTGAERVDLGVEGVLIEPKLFEDIRDIILL